MNFSQKVCIGILLIIFQFSCDQDSELKFVKGNWMCINNDDYTEMEISDSIYFLIEEDNYFGLINAYNYRIENDSLFVINEIKQTRFTFIIDKENQSLSSLGTVSKPSIWKKFESDLHLSNWSVETNETYKEQFRKRKLKYYKPIN